MNRASLVRVLRWTLVVATLVAVVLVVVRNVDQLDEVSFHLTWGWLAAGLVPALLATALLPPAYRAVVHAFGDAPGLDHTEARRVWWVSQAARYLPTSIPGFATRIVMTRRTGASTSAATASLAVEIGLFVALLTTIGAAAAPFLPWWLRILAGVAGSVGVLGAAWAAPALVDLARRWTQLVEVPARAGMVRAAGTYLTSVSARAARAPFVAFGVVAAPFEPQTVAAVIAADNLGSAAGIVGVTPAGLGTREAATAALLQPTFGLGRALAITVALRVYDLVVELGWLGEASLRTLRSDGSRGVTQPEEDG